MPILSGCVSGKVSSQGKIGGPFADYDTAFQDSIMHRCHDLMGGKRIDRNGKIVLRFHLNYDGSVSDMNIIEDNVGAGQAVICKKAVSDAAPFASWPQDMIRMVGINFRVITFTFNY